MSDDDHRDALLAPSTPSGRGKVLLIIAIAILVLATDIITKSVDVATLTGRPNIRLLGGFLQLTETRNPGAAFSIGGPSTTVLFTAIAVGVIIFILRTSRRIRSTAWAATLGLLLGGATGNLVDRILRYPGPFRGYVVDWIELPHWPVFNVADSAIVCGGVLAVILAMRNIRIDGSRPGHGPQPPARGVGGTGGPAAGGPGGPAATDRDPADGSGDEFPGGGGA